MTGHTHVDALAAGTLASVRDIPIILTEGNALSPVAAKELTKLEYGNWGRTTKVVASNNMPY